MAVNLSLLLKKRRQRYSLTAFLCGWNYLFAL